MQHACVRQTVNCAGRLATFVGEAAACSTLRVKTLPPGGPGGQVCINLLTWMARKAPRMPVSPAATLLSAYADRAAMPVKIQPFADAQIRLGLYQRFAQTGTQTIPGNLRMHTAEDQPHPEARGVSYRKGWAPPSPGPPSPLPWASSGSQTAHNMETTFVLGRKQQVPVLNAGRAQQLAHQRLRLYTSPASARRACDRPLRQCSARAERAEPKRGAADAAAPVLCQRRTSGHQLPCVVHEKLFSGPMPSSMHLHVDHFWRRLKSIATPAILGVCKS